MKTQKITCEIARNICLVKILAKLGHFPTKESEKEAWFLSPFRSETQASFKVSKILNRWYDHGEGIGGNIIDFIIKLKGYSVKEVLDFLSQDISFSFQQQAFQIPEEKENVIEVSNIKKLENKALLNYLSSRSIDIEIAKHYCNEIYYKMKDKTFFSIAFKNDLGGYELRNKYFKGCSGKKAITTIGNNNKCVCVFEGFIDFLSYKTLYKSKQLNEDYIISNSTALIQSLPQKLQRYQNVYACLDNDNAGQKATAYLKQNHKGFFDCRMLYSQDNDINDYLMSKVSKKREQVGQGLTPPIQLALRG